MNVYLIIAVILIAVTLLAVPLLRRVVVNSVEDPLLRNDFATFDKRIDRWYIKLFIQPFNVDFLKLNRALLAGDRQGTDEMFEHFDHVNLNEKQKENVYLRGFEYYLSAGDRALTDKYYELIKGLDDGDLKTYVDHLYDIYVLKGWTYLDEMLAQADTLPKDQLFEVYSMISAMYENKGDEKNAQIYLDKIENEFTDMLEKK